MSLTGRAPELSVRVHTCNPGTRRPKKKDVDLKTAWATYSKTLSERERGEEGEREREGARERERKSAHASQR